jgi:hypothetical protein
MPFQSVTRFSSHRVSQPRRSNSLGLVNTRPGPALEFIMIRPEQVYRC